MALELKMTQSLRMEQKLVMTQQLQLAIRLLQLNRMEMAEEVYEQLEQNPVLEEAGTTEEAPEPQPEGETTALATQAEDAPPEERPAGESETGEFDWENYFENYSLPRTTTSTRGGSEDLPSFEAVLSKPSTLADHLLWQLSLLACSEDEREMGALIIGNLNDDGWLVLDDHQDPLEPLAQQMTEREREAVAAGAAELPPEEGQSGIEGRAERLEYWRQVAEDALEGIQEFDPPGVAARDLRECLLLQCVHVEIDPDHLVWRLVRDFLPNLERKSYQAIGKAIKVAIEEILEAERLISTLDPKPGRSYSTESPQYITPDIHVHKVGDDYHIVLNEDGLPKLRISDRYRQELRNRKGSRETREYIQGKLKSATWFIRSMHQRQRTIFKVTESIVKRQRQFFDQGVDFLKPMVLRDVAADIGMHESTVSRVTTNKYVHTPQGIFELKYFFTSGLKPSMGGGADVSSVSVREKIRQLVADESQTKPLSDQAIAQRLAAGGVKIARRTVAKYREMLGIPPSAQRKRIL